MQHNKPSRSILGLPAALVTACAPLELSVRLQPCDLSLLEQERFKRVYVGSEFCENGLWQGNHLEGLLKNIMGRSIPFTLITPFFSERGLEQFILSLEKIIGLFCVQTNEITCNDWGAILAIQERFPNAAVTINAGRLLSGQKTDPRPKIGGRVLTPQAKRHFRESNLEHHGVISLLGSLGINRIEIGNLSQGISTKTLEEAGIKISVHYPYLALSTSKNCLVRGTVDGDNLGFHCPRYCDQMATEMRHPSFSFPIIACGQTRFISETGLENLQQKGVDRLIWHPRPTI